MHTKCLYKLLVGGIFWGLVLTILLSKASRMATTL